MYLDSYLVNTNIPSMALDLNGKKKWVIEDGQMLTIKLPGLQDDSIVPVWGPEFDWAQDPTVKGQMWLPEDLL